ncbi:MAG: hypothetical protein ACHQU0_00450 [Candidatus Paceibacteria bacterium]
MRRTLSAVFALALLLPGVAAAQSLGGTASVNTDPFTVSVAPQYPAPMNAATLSFISSTLDLTNATMTVSVGSKQIYQGSVQPVILTTGKAGSVTTAKVTITSAGTPYTQSVVIQPEDVSLIAEPISSAPVLYPGKPLVPLEGSTRIVAMASFADAAGKKIDPATLSYSWTVDGALIADSSGIGKSSILVASPLQYRLRDVSVVVQSQIGSLAGGSAMSLDPVAPSVRVYENDPLLGIRFDRALAASYTIRGAEASLYAAPFSFPTTGGTPLLHWFLNGTSAQTGNLITLRPSGNGQGSASLSLTAGSGTSLATANLSLLFGAAPSSNLFFGL